MSSFKQTTGWADSNVYIGPWIDWSRGRVLGATVTVESRYGGFLIALLALFVSFSGSSLWRIVCFAFHSIYSTKAAGDALYHQRQTILRNSANATYGLGSLFQALWAWRQAHNVRHPYRRILPLSLCTVLMIGVCATASTFSSKITTAIGHEVLISAFNCGIPLPGENATMQALMESYWPYMSSQVILSSNYALRCYWSRMNIENCRQYIKPQLPTSIRRDAPCPFQEHICRLRNGNIVFDTGYLDSHFDLGINAPPEDRVIIRRVTSCAPLVTEGYKRVVQYGGAVTKYIQYLYGPSVLNWGSGNEITYEYPYTEYPEKGFPYLGSVPVEKSQYIVGTLDSRVSNGIFDKTNSTWKPIPTLASHDADTVILFLSANWVLFSSEVDDPWYSAHRHMGQAPVLSGTGVGNNFSFIIADEAASPLACKIQQQFCNPSLSNESRCSRLSGSREAVSSAQQLWQSEEQKTIFDWISKFDFPDMSDTALALTNSGLASRFALAGGVQGPLPHNQWQIDAEFLHNTSLAALQSIAVSIAKGPSKPNVLKWLFRPQNPGQQKLCKSQKVYSNAHFNFSVFFLALTISLGTVIITVSYTLESLISWIQRRYGLNSFARLEWATNETLQLQRLAHEQLGVGEWNRCLDAVPITVDGRERLAMLDVEDPEHPRLKQPPSGFEGLPDEEAGPSSAGERDGGRGRGGETCQKPGCSEMAVGNSENGFAEQSVLSGQRTIGGQNVLDMEAEDTAA